MEGKFERTASEIKTDLDNSYCRRKRIVLFRMPNTKNDQESVQQLFEEL